MLERLPEATDDRGSARRRRSFLVILVVVAVLQISWFAWQRLPQVERHMPLNVILDNKALPDSTPAPEAAADALPEPEPLPAVERVPEIAELPEADVAESPSPETELAELQDPLEEHLEESLEDQVHVTPPRPHTKVMLENARSWLQTRDLPEPKQRVRTFSTADLALAAGEDDDGEKWRRPQAIRQFARVPEVIRYQDKRGYTTLRKIDEWGNITCVQERGFAGDANPPLWYIIPNC